MEIKVEGLSRIYKTQVKEHGLKASIKSLFHPEYKSTVAVSNLNFQIEKGEMVGFIGPNGAGKTTTLKMMSGLLHQSSGNVTVAGYIPYQRKPEYLKKISIIMGNRGQLSWDLTIMDSLYIIKEIYGVSEELFHKRLDELASLLEIEPLLKKHARNLSLGERAKCEFAGALLYGPEVLFLDEPTLGMDVSIQIRLRNFIKEYCMRHESTVMLTSHYMADITSLCSRVILINKGKMIYDGKLNLLSEKLAPFKLIKFSSYEVNEQLFHKKLDTILDKAGVLIEENERNYVMRVKKDDVTHIVSQCINNLDIGDLTVEDPAIEEVIDQIYREEVK